MIGESVGAYKIISELGRGGMGVVYLADHRHMGRRAAIKFLLPELSRLGDRLQRFFLEARAASLVDHDGIVRVFDCDVHVNGSAYIVMEYLNGQSLQAFLAGRGRLAAAEAASIIVRVADALAAAHDRGIVHRDLKPENIFVLASPPGGIKVLDFGVAKLSHAFDNAPYRTQSGAVVGTPLYMSPEQARGSGGLVDARADIYSMGCILFEMLSGRPPFTHASANELLLAHIGTRPPPLDPALPPSLRVLVEGMLAKEAGDRPGLREEVIPILQAVVSGRTAWFEGMVAAPAATVTVPLGEPSPVPGTLGSVTSQQPVPPAATVPTDAGRARRKSWWALGAVAVLGALGIGFGWRFAGPRERAAEVPAAAVAPDRAPAGPAIAPPTPVPVAPPPEATPAAVAPRAAAASPRRSGATRGAGSARSRASGRTVASARLVPSEAVTDGRRVQLLSEPPGSVICTPNVPTRVGYTNGSVELPTDRDKTTFILYRAGYHLERVTLAAAETGPRTVKLRPLTEDDLAPLPPCR
jgi:serine/threonine-protein kinase